MPRANRVFLPGHVWHITHRCHRQQFGLKFIRDWRRRCDRLFEALKRFGLCVLSYRATASHIHLLVKTRGRGGIVRSMQLVTGRTGQDYNRREILSGRGVIGHRAWWWGVWVFWPGIARQGAVPVATRERFGGMTGTCSRNPRAAMGAIPGPKWPC